MDNTVQIQTPFAAHTVKYLPDALLFLALAIARLVNRAVAI